MDVEQWLDSLDPDDPNVVVQDGRYLRRISAADDELRDAVADARANGESWGLIGMVLGIDATTAEQRFAT
ncbi:hypothetical protein [Mycobacterium paraterrae]|uniref:Uncharacterized protein n=1 Tax=Mycobacterium paraterrae TaxID=577492 RepID=A0ABY3VLZ0_9MYCO|nr:hypothetical protein [Mycobacterium paraterrae]UMB67683.1 hypothetical protein MKK62_14325 [Mycobacterium paraterrae]